MKYNKVRAFDFSCNSTSIPRIQRFITKCSRKFSREPSAVMTPTQFSREETFLHALRDIPEN